MQIHDIFKICQENISPSHGLYSGLFMAGIVGSLTHCVGMCGPFVIAQSGDLTKYKDSLLLPYHLGRMTTYVIMAIALTSVLNVIFLYVPIRSYITAPILMVAGLIFLLNAFPSLSRLLGWLHPFTLSLPYQWVQKMLAQLPKNGNTLHHFAMGVILGFMPCGLVTAALLASSTAPHIWESALAMGCFSLGTMPALILTACAGKAIRDKWPTQLSTLNKTMMVWSSLWLFTIAGMLLI